ncbi:Cyclin-U4-1 [Striga hermonthica]|uniref:Cyclin-U4-1 n=1 Tax=Striga hermonthica TaxID=68872 RepID=A0A9N7RAV3_STRHE|nr:Cyclin-U4-1 [Striga hermonthica]
MAAEAEESSSPKLIGFLSLLLQRVAESNDLRCEAHTQKISSVFHGLTRPTISIHSYLQRIFKYANCSTSCYIVAYVYLDRFTHSQPALKIDSLNVHRLLITSVMISAKFMDEMYYNNAYYAKVGGMSTREMNILEVDFLFGLGFHLNVTPSTFHSYCSHLQKEMMMMMMMQPQPQLNISEDPACFLYFPSSSLSSSSSSSSSSSKNLIHLCFNEDESSSPHQQQQQQLAVFGDGFLGRNEIGKRAGETVKRKKMDAGSGSEVAAAIQSLGEGFMRMEKVKMDMRRQIEEIRVEMELKRTQMILESQQRIVEAFAKAITETSANKKQKRMHSMPDC